MSLSLPFVQHLRGKRVVLASGSKRRKEILSAVLGLKHEVVPSTFPETLDKSKYSPKDYVLANAREKGMEVYTRLNFDADLIISADTVVCLDEEILEKPRDPDHAFEMLSKLNGNKHYVYTGISLIYKKSNSSDPIVLSFVDETEVIFRKNSEEMIRAYIDTGDPFDKAGGYGYQGIASVFVEKINGCYYNVVGLPSSLFVKLEEL
ncbi:463_t:CDS:2 [Paraglomus occultum]|uniref:463_t:CDS:1 n=1 Tax=Paraglomus occultum TaxID=144539 RepID=A0A9N9D1I1_9GLOM|nr:463_t:CDS:2 [Paraglomus occultum]